MESTNNQIESPESQEQSTTIPQIEQQPISTEQQVTPAIQQPIPSTSSLLDQHISPSRSALSDQQSTPSKDSTSRSKMEPIDALSVGLLSEFNCLKDLETQLEQLVNNQQGLIENITSMNIAYTHNQELMEAQLMMKKMNLYRMKLKKIKSDMLYIKSSTQSLLQKSIDLQNIKVNQKAEQVRRFDYEIGLIAKSNQNS
ncbi:unnamed protein product [Chironomus riparius]|uniref:Biogenesis of lysosome-related organelles complex 1 subunit 6 n=1 Tax=Chironomus riparius TaxID=315576 RepID=A0A9N9X054_9DIPT|nr:unnamed protein product [Chironomus riparius]